MATVSSPTYSDLVRQAFLLEPLGGPKDVFYYLDRFPEEIYNKSPDSHLYKYMRALLGESGVNWIKKDFLEARLMLDEIGIDSFDLDQFFGSPFAFGRIAAETFDDDVSGLITKDQWEQIKAKNARYRNRALDFINGARAGNTPLGMRLVSKAGLGHDVNIIENYRYLFDVHSDDPLGLDYYGKTLSTEEMIVLPKREVGVSESQKVSLAGIPSSGNFYFVYNGDSSLSYSYVYDNGSGPITTNIIPWNATSDQIRLALESIPQIGPGNVKVTGGPGPLIPWLITFQNALSNKDVPQLQVVQTDIGSADLLDIRVTTLIGGIESLDELAVIPAKDQYTLQSALDRIRPQTTIPTIGSAFGSKERVNWKQVSASSEYIEVVRYVTGSPSVAWPTSQPYYWIRANVEEEGPRVPGDLQYHYTGFHNVSAVTASSGNTADMILADYAEPLFVTSAKETGNRTLSLINGIYPVDYQQVSGVPPIQYKSEQFWESSTGSYDEWVILQLPFVQCMNYISFDVQRTGVQIDIDYDLHDQGDGMWIPVKPVDPYSNVILPPTDTTHNTWASVGLTFRNPKDQLVWTRALRLRLTRLQNYSGSISLRNLRIARNLG